MNSWYWNVESLEFNYKDCHHLKVQNLIGIFSIKVLWDTNEETWELPLNNIKADDPVTVSKYVEKKGLVNQPYTGSGQIII